MRVECRKLANGDQYFSFVYWDGDKRVRLKKHEHPHFHSRADAEAWAKGQEAERESAKARIILRLKWKTQYYEFAKISDDYIEYCKKVQPNSWKNTGFYLNNYVLPFFLEIKKSNNPNNWSLHFEDFRNWLEDEAKGIKKSAKLIAYSTKNHCIKTLNTFLEFLVKQNLMDKANVYKVSGFPSSKINSRDASSLISAEEFSAVHGILQATNPLVATFFKTAYFTGMRFNEIFGLSLDDLFIGELDDNVLRTALDHHRIEYFGYVVLESQPATKIRERLKNGSILRKPLKGKPKIAEKHNRLVPIIDKSLFNDLAKLYKAQEEKLTRRVYGKNPKDYVLFEDLTQSEAVVALREAYGKTKFTPKSYHCCRHTRCTELVGKTRDFVLARYWLGHARQETTLKYTHIYQQSARTARKKHQRVEILD